jgi:hypothetical protein
VPTNLTHSDATKNRGIVALIHSRNKRTSSRSNISLTLFLTASNSNTVVNVSNTRLKTLNVSKVVNGEATGLSFGPIKDFAHLHNSVGAFLSLTLNELTHVNTPKG